MDVQFLVEHAGDRECSWKTQPLVDLMKQSVKLEPPTKCSQDLVL